MPLLPPWSHVHGFVCHPKVHQYCRAPQFRPCGFVFPPFRCLRRPALLMLHPSKPTDSPGSLCHISNRAFQVLCTPLEVVPLLCVLSLRLSSHVVLAPVSVDGGQCAVVHGVTKPNFSILRATSRHQKPARRQSSSDLLDGCTLVRIQKY